MTRLVDYDALNASKANFDDAYRAADPRRYFRDLGELDYVIPHFALPVFRRLVQAWRAANGGAEVTVADVGCSYGINAALLKYPFSYRSLQHRYVTPELQSLTPAELLAFDKRFFSSWPTCEPVRVVGIDIARPAVSYAQRCGVLDDGVVVDLEAEPVPAEALAPLAALDMILSTGCVGYVTHRTFQRLLSQVTRDDPPWVASFVLRMFPYDDIASTLRQYNLETEKLSGRTFTQRAFKDDNEREDVLAALQRLGIDPRGKESEGYYHAELFVSRPAKQIEECPLEDLLAPVLG